MNAAYAPECHDSSSLCCSPEPPHVEKRLDAWRSTIAQLLAEGFPPVVPLDAPKGLHARGGYDQAVAEFAHAAQCPRVVAR